MWHNWVTSFFCGTVRYHSGRFLGEHKVITPEQFLVVLIPRYNFMVFYVFKLAVAIAFLCENAVGVIKISFISMILNLNCFYSIFANKRPF